MKKIHTFASSTAAAAMLLAALPALAQTSAAVNTTTNVNTPVGGVAVSASVTAKLNAFKNKADQEIARRITAMAELAARIAEMKKLSPNDKTTLGTELQTQANALNLLKAKIDADTDVDVMKTDVKSITDSYRIFMLIMPRDRVIAAADRISTIVDQMVVLGAKLELRVQAAKAAGKDTAKLESTLADMKAKLTDAQAQAQATVNLVVPLQPDMGDKTVMKTNQTAFATARADLKAGASDLKAARADVKTLLDGIKAFGTISGSAAASTTVSQ